MVFEEKKALLAKPTLKNESLFKNMTNYSPAVTDHNT